MKHLRLFPNAQVRDSVLADIDYPVLHSTDGVGIGVKPDSKTIPFYIDVRGTVNLIETSGLQMSTDGKTWTDTVDGVLPTGKTYFRVASDQTTPLEPKWTEKSNSDYDIGGNINSLVKTSFENDTTGYKFFISNYGTFYNRKKLKSAGNLILPATTLIDQCYYEMFKNCKSLTTAPELPATTLAGACYSCMFQGCTSLITAPSILPAMTMDDSSCYNMFKDCTSLTAAPELPATTLANWCYNGMFSGCTSLTTAPSILPAAVLAEKCYNGMFQGCRSLTTAPELPAMTLAKDCYGNMFRSCTSLTIAPELPAMTLAEKCYSGMFDGCTSLTTAPELPATTLDQYCYYDMFRSCASLTTAPELPAETLVTSCYLAMFTGCTNLNYIKCLATDIPSPFCTENWMNGVASTGTFVKNKSMESWTTGVYGIPEGWTVQDAA